MESYRGAKRLRAYFSFARETHPPGNSHFRPGVQTRRRTGEEVMLLH